MSVTANYIGLLMLQGLLVTPENNSTVTVGGYWILFTYMCGIFRPSVFPCSCVIILLFAVCIARVSVVTYVPMMSFYAQPHSDRQDKLKHQGPPHAIFLGNSPGYFYSYSYLMKAIKKCFLQCHVFEGSNQYLRI